MKTDIVPFTLDMIYDAGEVLAKCHRRNRKILPLLPSRFERPEIASKAVKALLEKNSTSGYAAFRDRRMVAYLLGDHSVEPWGRCGWMRLPGSALAEGENVATMQDLYVKLGDDWINQGIFIHHTYQSIANRDVVEAWFSLDFGKERVDAILDFDQVEIPDIQLPDGVQIRRAGLGDNEHFASMSHLIFRELEKSPYWHPTPPEVWDDSREGWAELADDKTVTAWLAFEEDKSLGMIAFWPPKESETDMLLAPKMSYMSVAVTRPEGRGRGIGTALTWNGLKHCKDSGDEYCVSNWISPNLAASRFWPRFGFQEVAYRLTKNINPMIAWTKES